MSTPGATLDEKIDGAVMLLSVLELAQRVSGRTTKGDEHIKNVQDSLEAWLLQKEAQEKGDRYWHPESLLATITKPASKE